MNRPKSHEPAPALNPKLTSIIPDFLEQAAQTRNAISPALNSLLVEFASLQDHIRFEIEKAQLAIARADWDGRPKRPSRAVMVAHLAHLEAALITLSREQLFGSLAAIRSASESIESLLEGSSPTEQAA